MARGQRGNDAGVDATAQEAAQWNVSHETALHGPIHQLDQLMLLLLIAELVFGDFVGVVGNLVPSLTHHLAILDIQVVAGQQLLHTLENAGRARDVVELQILAQGHEIELARHAQRHHRFHLRGEEQLVFVAVDKQGFHPVPVAGNEQ